MRVFLVAALLPAAAGWCCRACGKCLCKSYGKCPRPKATIPLLPPLENWSAGELSEFIRSISPGGARQSCPENCDAIALIAKVPLHGMDGAGLSRLLAEHAQNLQVNVTVATIALPRLLDGLVAERSVAKQGMAFITRLRDAVEHATTPPPNATFR